MKKSTKKKLIRPRGAPIPPAKRHKTAKDYKRKKKVAYRDHNEEQ